MTARVVLPEDEITQERRQFWQFVIAGAAMLLVSLFMVLAIVHHLDRDAEVLRKLAEAQYTIARQEALIKVGQDFGRMAVKLATVPPSDYAYDIVAVPRIGEE